MSKTSDNLMRYFIEFVGTFLFVSVILVTGNPIAIGVALAAVVFWGGKISGGAFNPAVALGLYARNNIDTQQFFIYVTVQLLAAVCAYYYWKYVSEDAKVRV